MFEGNPAFYLGQVVADAAAEFIKDGGLVVDDMAQYALLSWGKRGEEDLERVVREGRLSLEEIKAALKEVLGRARASAERAGRSSISDSDVCAAMEGKCPLPPWC